MHGTFAKFQLREAGPTCLLLYFEGGLSWEDRDVLADEVERYVRTRPAVRDVVIDMSAVQFVNSAGLGALFQLYRRVRQRGGRLALANVPALVRRVFTAVGLDRLADVVADVPAALDQFERGSPDTAPHDAFAPAQSAVAPLGLFPAALAQPEPPTPRPPCTGDEEMSFTAT